MKNLGIEVSYLNTDQEVALETYMPSSIKISPYKSEGVHRVTISTETQQEDLTLPKGTAVVYMDQKNANLIIEILEPEAPNSFISNNLIPVQMGKEIGIYRILNFK